MSGKLLNIVIAFLKNNQSQWFFRKLIFIYKIICGWHIFIFKCERICKWYIFVFHSLRQNTSSKELKYDLEIVSILLFQYNVSRNSYSNKLDDIFLWQVRKPMHIPVIIKNNRIISNLGRFIAYRNYKAYYHKFITNRWWILY